DGVDYPIPGNDDAARAIALYCDLAARAALDGMAANMGESIDIGEMETPMEEALSTGETPAESAAPAAGYIAPPLDGVWATAPYLHNGSVPSMAALLAPGTRPRHWRHVLPREYDAEAMGWRFEALEKGQEAEAEARARVQIYDTTRHGYGNGGHSYGSDLSEAERAALIEYLKTL
ncbi:MAG: 30S ribosomal protein S2, partial [Roseicyclus sp.]